MVVAWVNPSRTYLHEFYNELRICLQEQTLLNNLVIKNTQIHRENGQIILSLLEIIPEIKKPTISDIQVRQEIVLKNTERALV